jgi:alpha-1,2-mannosyltransferase
VWLRLHGGGGASAAVTLTLCLVGVGIGAWVARRLVARGDDVAALLALAIGTLLGSPISWSHHWLWIVPVLLLFCSRRRFVSAWVAGSFFWIGPLNWLGQPDPPQSLHMSVADQFAAAQYVLAGIVVLGLLAFQGPVATAADRSTTPARPGASAPEPVVT